MSVKKGLVCLVSILLLFTLSVSVSAFSVTITPIIDSISMFDEAEFELTITNSNSQEDKIRVYYSDVLWNVHTEPRTDSTMIIPGISSRTTVVALRPNNLEFGTYVIPINVKSQKSNILQIHNVVVSVLSQEEIGGEFYGTAVRTNIVMDESVDPREELEITVQVENQNPKNNPDLTLVIESDLFRDSKKISLGPYEQKEITFIKTLNNLEAPDKHFIEAYLLVKQADNRSLVMGRTPRSTVFEIISYGQIDQLVDTKKGFLTKEETITVINNANLPKSETIKVETNLIKKLFQKTSIDSSEISENNKRYYGFDISLSPAESITIVIKTNYSPLFWIIIILITITVLYYILRSPIILQKSAVNLIMKEGGISEMKVMVHVRNRSHQSIDHVIITDRLPHIAEVVKDFPIGTLHPTSILKHDKKGTILKWEIDTLEGFEERILVYNIKSRLSVLGEFRLPQTQVKFKHYGKTRKTFSNKYVSK